MKLDHMPKNGAALAGLRAAAELIARQILAMQLDMPGICARTGLNPPVILRFLNQHSATEHTLGCLEKAFHVTLPRPKAALFSLTTFSPKWCGFEYEIAGPTGPLTGWHKGTETQVREHIAAVVKRAHYVSTVLV